MAHNPKLIVMLTHNDLTVLNAAEIFEECKASKAEYWGFKEHPLPLAEMKSLYSRMKECGKTTFLWTFTIGSAFFDKKFGEGFMEQIDRVVTFIEGHD